MYVSSWALEFLTPWITHLTSDEVEDRDVIERVIGWAQFEREKDKDGKEDENVFRYKSQADTAWTIQLFSFLIHASLGLTSRSPTASLSLSAKPVEQAKIGHVVIVQARRTACARMRQK